MELKNDITKSVLKLMRVMRRRPVRTDRPLPPAVGRTLLTLGEHDGVSSAELCELMDVRPSSLSELLGRMEENGLVQRVSDENDKRTNRVLLTDAGRESVERIEKKYEEENARLAACFTEEELEQFCALCERLSAHMETLPEQQERHPHGPCGHHGPHGHHGHHGPHGPHGPHGHHHCHGAPEGEKAE